jgi:hypothetical protein
VTRNAGASMGGLNSPLRVTHPLRKGGSPACLETLWRIKLASSRKGGPPPPPPNLRRPRGVHLPKSARKKHRQVGLMTPTPQRKTVQISPDFHQRQGHAPRFAGKNSAWFAPNGTIGGSFSPTAAGKLVGGRRVGSDPPGREREPPLQKLGPPLRPPWFFQLWGAAHVHRTVYFSPLFFDVPLPVTAPCVMRNGPP